MKDFNLRLEFKQSGSLIDAQVTLEGEYRVGYWSFDGKKKLFYKSLPNYSIKDSHLHVDFAIEGKSGARGILKVQINKADVAELQCIIEDGVSSCLTSKNIEVK